MKKPLSIPLVLFVLSVLFFVLAAAVAPITQTKDLKINSTQDSVAITIQKGTLTSNIVEAFSGSTLKFAIPYTGILGTAYGGTGSATTNASFAALSPLTTRGDILVMNSSTQNARLAIGAVGTFPRSDGTDWAMSKVVLTNDVSNVLPIANGGTGGATAAAAKTALGIQFGSATTADDGTVTNTFSAVFSAIPKLVLTPVACTSPTNTFASLSESNVVITIGQPSIVVNWVAGVAP